MRKTKTERMVVISLLAAFAYILLLIDFPVLLTFPWLKIDFSDIPILIGAFLYGPAGGAMIAFVRSTLKFITSGGDLGSLIGNTTGFLASLTLIFPVYYLSKKGTSTKGLIRGLALGTVMLTVFMAVANYYVITPFYLYVLGMDFGMPIAEMVLYGVVPFNIIKGIIVSSAFVVVYKKLLPTIEKRLTVVDHKVSQ